MRNIYYIIFVFIVVSGCNEQESEIRSVLIEQEGQKTIISGNPITEDQGLSNVQDQPGNEFIRVIVRLKTSGEWSDESISERQDKLLAKLSDKKIRVVRRYVSLPMLALEVDKDTYQTLKMLPTVESVDVDALAKPM